jgi:hypothetical protein
VIWVFRWWNDLRTRERGTIVREIYPVAGDVSAEERYIAAPRDVRIQRCAHALTPVLIVPGAKDQ